MGILRKFINFFKREEKKLFQYLKNKYKGINRNGILILGNGIVAKEAKKCVVILHGKREYKCFTKEQIDTVIKQLKTFGDNSIRKPFFARLTCGFEEITKLKLKLNGREELVKHYLKELEKRGENILQECFPKKKLS
jgi:hypothetical protein